MGHGGLGMEDVSLLEAQGTPGGGYIYCRPGSGVSGERNLFSGKSTLRQYSTVSGEGLRETLCEPD